METDLCHTTYQMIVNRTYSMTYRQFIILFDAIIQPAPSVLVSTAPNDTIKSERNITYIVLAFG